MNGTAHLTLVAPAHEQAARQSNVAAVRSGSLSPLRLTRRGRVAVLVVFLAVLLAGGVLFGPGTSRATGEAGPGPEYAYVVVQPGQTLWGIAKAAAPDTDPRATIERIRDLNALSDTGVQAGQRIALP